MNIVHRFAISHSDLHAARLARIGVRVPGEGTGSITVKIRESDARFPAVLDWATEAGAVHLTWTEFSDAERQASEWLALRGNFNHGYPLPDEDFGYLKLTYDLSEYCEECGTGAKQVHPFRIKGEPKWGTRSVMQLYWVYGEYFVTPSLYRDVFRPAGVGSRAVLDIRGRELESVVQLEITQSVEVSIEGQRVVTCTSCGRRKVLPVVRGYFPAPVAQPGGANLATRTEQWFGSGHEGHTEVLIARDLHKRLDAARVRGVDLLPCR